jgi:hypothetical protein
MVIVTVLPTTAKPCAPVVCRFTTVTGGLGVAAAKTAADVAAPPSALVRSRLTAAVPAAPKVQATVNVVVLLAVAEPHVPFTGVVDTTGGVAVEKPVPVIVKVTVEFGVAVVGLTLVIVGPGSMTTAAVLKGRTVYDPPSVLVTL